MKLPHAIHEAKVMWLLHFGILEFSLKDMQILGSERTLVGAISTAGSRKVRLLGVTCRLIPYPFFRVLLFSLRGAYPTCFRLLTFL